MKRYSEAKLFQSFEELGSEKGEILIQSRIPISRKVKEVVIQEASKNVLTQILNYSQNLGTGTE